MGKADVSLKNYLSDKERFADLFNAYLFDGIQVIKPDNLEIINNESSVILPDNMGKRRTVTRFSDLRMRWENTAELAILSAEFQDEVHYAMPVKSMVLDGLCYIDQMKEIWRSIEHSVDKNELGVAELFSRFRKKDKLYPVIPMVFYYGDNWDGSTSLYEMFDFDNEILTNENLETLSKYIPNYTINLFNPRNISDYSIFKTDLQIIFGMLQYKEDKNALRRYIMDNEAYFSSMSYEAATATGTLLKNYSWFDRAINKFSDKGKEVCDMCKAIDDMISDGRAEGRREGILGTVTAFRSIGWANDDIVNKLIEVYGVTLEDAVEFVNG